MSDTINIYQVFTRLFQNDNQTNKIFGTIDENGCSKFEHFNLNALTAIKEFGITHIWFTGIIRHATCTNYSNYGIPANNPQIIKGRAGSPYAITDYYDVNPDLAIEPQNRMREFDALVARCHAGGLKVIIDFVPNHVAREYKSTNLPAGISDLGANDNTNLNFSPSNNFYYIPNEAFRVPDGIGFPYAVNTEAYIEFPAKATGNDAFTANPVINDWYETIKLNYGVDYTNNKQQHFNTIPDTWKKMLHIMQFWASKGVDALRCDMAELVPAEFWGWAIAQVKKRKPGFIFIAEVYNPNEYRKFIDAGFDFLYDKVGLYDISRSLIEGNGSTSEITQLWQRYEGFSHKMLRFLENHDEQRIASPQFANSPYKAFPAIIIAATLNTGPFMLYFGQEIGEKATDTEGFSGNDGRTSIFDYWCLKEFQKWVNKGTFTTEQLSKEQIETRNFYKTINQLRLNSKAINRGSFYDLMWVNHHNNCNNKLFAYLRFYEKDILLVLINFDTTNSYNIMLKIPTDAMQMAGLPAHTTWQAKEIIGNTIQFNINPLNAQNEGFEVHVPNMSGLIFQLNY